MTKACTLLIFIFHIANGFQFTSNNNIAHPVFSEKTESSDVPAFRIGHGYDIHRLTDQLSNPLVIAGVKVAHSKGPDAHSDGDAVYHR